MQVYELEYNEEVTGESFPSYICISIRAEVEI